MAAEDAVLVAANAREQMRQSLDRMEYHLGRGVRGARGVQREVAFLDALSRQSTRLGQATAGVPAVVGGQQGLGQKALAAMSGGNSATIGRTKSSLLATFSDDTMFGAREFTYLTDAPWVWRANASACAACLSNHGSVYRGGMIPEHPSCLCYPVTPQQAAADGVSALSDQQMLQVLRGSNNPRFRAQASTVDRGINKVSDIVRQNRRPNTGRFYQQTLRNLQQGGQLPVPQVRPGGAPVQPQPQAIATDIPPVTAAPDLGPVEWVEGWEGFGTRMELGAKKHLQMLKDAQTMVDDWIRATGNNALRPLLDDVAKKITRVQTKTGNPTRKAGHFLKRENLDGTSAGRELWFKMRRYSDALDDYNAQVKVYNAEVRRLQQIQLDFNRAGNYPEANRIKAQIDDIVRPKKTGITRDTTIEEMADVLLHEMAHALDDATKLALRKSAKADILPEFRKVARSNDPYAGAFEYGGELGLGGGSAGETVSEAIRMYYNGTGLFTPDGLTPLTAVEWRAKYPKLAEWVENNVLTLEVSKLYG